MAGPNGFTLIELLVVIAIISVTLAVVGPRLAGRAEGAALYSATADLQTLAKAARGHAALTGRTSFLSFGRGGAEISLATKMEDDINTEQQLVMPVRRLPEGVRAQLYSTNIENGDPGSIRFWPDGSSDGGAVLLRDAKGTEMRLEIVATLGRFRMVERP